MRQGNDVRKFIDPKLVLSDQLARLCELENKLLAVAARAAEARRLVEERYRPEIEALQQEYVTLKKHALEYTKKYKDLLTTSERRSCDFAHGRVGFRQVPLSFAVVDLENLVKWATPLKLVRVITRPDLVNIKKYALENDIVPDGMISVPEHDEAYISLNSVKE